MRSKHQILWFSATIAGSVLLTADAFAAQGPQPSICTRSCWGARAPKSGHIQMSSLTRAIIHHTAGASDYTTDYETAKAKVRGVQNLHMDSNGWSDIGYHFLVSAGGHIFEGRSGSMTSLPKGAHDGYNVNSFGFTLLGYFHSPYNHNPVSTMRNALYSTIAWRMPSAWSPYGSGSYNGNTVGTLDGHRKVKATACPGDGFHSPYITENYSSGEARNEVNARKNGGSTANPPYYFGSTVEGWQKGNSSSTVLWAGGDWPGIAWADQQGSDCYWLGPATSFTGGSDASVNVQVYPAAGGSSHDMQLFWTTAADPSWGNGKSTPVVSYNRDGAWISINLNNTSSQWQGQTIKQLRLDFDTASTGTRWHVNHIYTQKTPRYWFSSNAQGWTTGGGLGGLMYGGSFVGRTGFIYADQTGTDPQFISPSISNFLAGANDVVRVWIYAQNSPTTNHNLKVYWTTSSSTSFSESKSVNVNYTGSSEWKLITLPVGGNGNWAGFITKLRIDPDHDSIGTRWLIDSVEIGHSTSQQ